MRKCYLLYLVIVSFLAGCVSTGVERRVDGNAFYSSYPKMVVKMSSDLLYIGKGTKEYEARVFGGGGSGNYSIESYTWSSPKLVLWIGFKELKDPGIIWLPVVNIWRNYPNVQDKGGYCTLQEEYYSYCIFKNRQGVFNKVYIRNTYGDTIQVVILLIDRTNTSDLKEFERNCDEALPPQASL